MRSLRNEGPYRGLVWQGWFEAAGTSLVEMLVALGVLAIGFLGVLPLFGQASTMMRVAADRQAASQVSFDAIEELRTMEFGDLEDDFEDRYVESDGVRVLLSIDVDRGDDPDTWEDGDDIDVNLVICNVAVQWRNVRGQLDDMTLGYLSVRP